MDQASGYLYPVVNDPQYGTLGAPIEGFTIPGLPMTAAAAAALVEKDID